MNGKAIIDSMQWIRDLSVVQKVTPPLSAAPSLYQAKSLGKQTGMIIYNYEEFDKLKADSLFGDDVGIVGLPHFKDGKRISNPSSLMFLGITSASKNVDMAWKYIHTITMDDVEPAQKGIEILGSVSLVTFKSLKLDQDPFMSVRFNELKYAEPSAYFLSPYWSKLMSDYVLSEIQRLSLSNLDISPWLTQLAATTDRRLAEMQPQP